MSEARFGRYCAEFDFRYNIQKISDAERNFEAIKSARGKRPMTGNIERSLPKAAVTPCHIGTPGKRYLE